MAPMLLSGIPGRLPSDGKEEKASGDRIAESEHQMGIFAVVVSVLDDVRMGFSVPVPLFPGSPMPLVCIPVSSMVVMLIVAFFSIGAFSVPTIAVVIRTAVMVTAAVGIMVSFIIPRITAIGMLFAVSMLLVVLRFVPPSFSRFIFPIIGKRNTGAAKGRNDNNAEDFRRFHWLSPNRPKRVNTIVKKFQSHRAMA